MAAASSYLKKTKQKLRIQKIKKETIKKMKKGIREE
jgi:hypothetical protein